MADKTGNTHHSPLKSKFSKNFRSGLKLPTLDFSIGNEENTTMDNEDENWIPVEIDEITNKLKKTTITVPSRSEIQKKFKVKNGKGDSFNGDGDFNINVKKRLISPSKKTTTAHTSKVKVKKNLKMRTFASIGGGGGDNNNEESEGEDEENPKTHSNDSRLELAIIPRDTFNSHSTPGHIQTETSTKSTQNKKGDHLESEINARISSVYRSIENLEKKRANFNNSIRAAARRTFAAGIKNKAMLSKISTTVSASTLDSDNIVQDEPETSRKSSRIIDLTRTYPALFGLDPMKVIESSEDESDVDENGVKDPRKKTKKSIRKYLEQLVKEEQPRDMSPIMPGLHEKQFLTKLQKRESQLNKEINDMRVNLDKMNVKAEREAKKAKVERNKTKGSNKGQTVTRLMANTPDKGPSRELTDYLQATGGTSGGWGTEDHQVFLRGWAKWNCRPVKLVDNLCQLLPNKKPEDIVEHIAWHDKYEKLNSANRAHIRQWQIQKRREQEIVYQMASESQKARLENEKRQQDLIRLRRVEEREKNRELLNSWKRSRDRQRLTKDDDNGIRLDTSEKIAKMDLEMSNVRKDVRDITSITRDIGKSLRSIQSAEDEMNSSSNNSNKRMTQRIKTTAVSSASSGFCEMTMEEIEAVACELAGDGENFLRQNLERKVRVVKPPNFLHHRDPSQTAESRKLLQEFRSRDEEMIEAKKRAILEKKEKMRNSSFLSDKQVKERIRKNKSMSKLLIPTKQWTIRKEILEQEKIENRNRMQDGSLQQQSENLFNPAAYVNSIPKLATPMWRKSTAS